jgi:putative membrane protein
MRDFLVRAIINAIAIAITAAIIPGIHVTSDIFPLLLVGIVLTLVNALIKPVIMLLSCPAVILTLGLFVLVINGLVLQIAAWLAGDAFQIDGFGWAVLGGIVLAIVNMVLEGLLGNKQAPAAGKDKRD